jgi:3',5'-nucleoside bisphosphate phosphatase
MSIDLHAHSTASDGTDTPAQLVRQARAAGLTALALTDHDTTAGWDEAMDEARAQGLLLVPGVELSCRVRGLSVHVLGYLHDPTHPGLAGRLAEIRVDRENRARRMVGLLAIDFPITWEDVLAHVQPGAVIGRPHIADALVTLGVVPTRDDAFSGLLAQRSRYNLPHDSLPASEAVRLVREAGGVPVLAHPLAPRRGRALSERAITRMAAAGLAGLEVDHPEHGPSERRRVGDLARSLGLLSTGASDYHGSGKPQRLGQCTTAPEVLEKILAAGKGTAAVR